MGGLLRSPKPPAQAVPQPAPTAAVAAPPETAAVIEQTTLAARGEARERVRRGLAGTITTTDRGILGVLPAMPAAARKTLLGQ